MYAHKLDGWQTLLYALHAEQHDDGTLALNVDLKIFAHALHITYVVHVNLNHLVLRLEEDGVVEEVLHRYPTLKLKLSFQLQRGMVKLIHAEGLEQIVDGIEPKAVNGMLRVGCGEDHEWRGCQGTHKIETVEVRHVDVHKHGVNVLAVNDLACRIGAKTLVDEFEKWHLAHIRGQLLQGKRFVIHDQTFYRIHRGRFFYFLFFIFYFLFFILCSYFLFYVLIFLFLYSPFLFLYPCFPFLSEPLFTVFSCGRSFKTGITSLTSKRCSLSLISSL